MESIIKSSKNGTSLNRNPKGSKTKTDNPPNQKGNVN
jgi:hypothetical protein